VAAGPAEVRQLAEQFNHTVAARVSFEDQLSHDALYDRLTGLANQALLLDRLSVLLANLTAAAKNVAVLTVGVDRFELVNTNLGYHVGDAALMTLGERLGSGLRPGQTLARLGGAEFAIATDVNDKHSALEQASTLLHLVAQPIAVAGSSLSLTASVGVAIAGPGVGAEELLRNATTAMHTAKEHGGARAEMFDASQRTRASARLSLENDLQTALARGQLYVDYQPVVAIPSGHITGAEALLRWTHPEHGQVSPATFIPLAEESGVIHELGQFVLDRACRQAVRWAAAGHPLRVAVNVSGRQLLDASFAEQVTRVLAITGLDPRSLCLELTESTLMEDVVRVATALHLLKGHGLSISVDDFGTGYSSLSYLQRFPVDELKIDRSFVNGLGQSDDRNLVAAIIGIAHALGLDVVAEGVETQQQASELVTLGCRSAQGYYYGRPQDPETLTTLLLPRKSSRDLTPHA
jgi:diguanylate cyclase (GGDEF)-like protein